MKHKLAIFFLNLILLVRADPASRIADGQIAYEGQFPYLAQVTIDSNLICGGSIIDQRWILTAAQCVINFAPEDIVIFVGTRDRVWQRGMIYKAEALIVHEDFKLKPGPTPMYDNDIALIRLETDISFNNYVNLIRVLEDPSSIIENSTAILTGWGSNRANGGLSWKLRYTTLEACDNPTCDGIWRRISGQGISQSNICTTAPVGRGACHGDLGGPLVSYGVQIGIASAMWPCAAGVPDVFTRVSSYSDWIRNIILTL